MFSFLPLIHLSSFFVYTFNTLWISSSEGGRYGVSMSIGLGKTTNRENHQQQASKSFEFSNEIVSDSWNSIERLSIDNVCVNPLEHHSNVLNEARMRRKIAHFPSTPRSLSIKFVFSFSILLFSPFVYVNFLFDQLCDDVCRRRRLQLLLVGIRRNCFCGLLVMSHRGVVSFFLLLCVFAPFPFAFVFSSSTSFHYNEFFFPPLTRKFAIHFFSYSTHLLFYRSWFNQWMSNKQYGTAPETPCKRYDKKVKRRLKWGKLLGIFHYSQFSGRKRVERKYKKILLVEIKSINF